MFGFKFNIALTKFKAGDCLQHDPELYACDNDWRWKLIKKVLDEATDFHKQIGILEEKLENSKKELDNQLRYVILYKYI